MKERTEVLSVAVETASDIVNCTTSLFLLKPAPSSLIALSSSSHLRESIVTEVHLNSKQPQINNFIPKIYSAVCRVKVEFSNKHEAVKPT